MNVKLLSTGRLDYHIDILNDSYLILKLWTDDDWVNIKEVKKMLEEEVDLRERGVDGA